MSVLFRAPENRDAVSQWADWGGGGSTPGEFQATHLTPVFASIRTIVDFVASLPVDFYRKSDNSRETVSTPELIRNVNDEFGLDTWLGQIAYGLATQGNAVGKVLQMGQSGPTMIDWSSYWSSIGYGETDPWWVNGQQLGYRSVAQVRWIVPPGRRLGLSPIEHYAAMVKAGIAAQDYANVGRGGGIPPTELTNTALSEIPDPLISAVKSAASSSFATGLPFVHGKDWQFNPVTIPPNQLLFIETLKLSANAIASIYGIDPRDVGGSAAHESLTYTNDESRPLTRAYNMRPYLVRIENAINRWIAGPVYMKFNIDATIRADLGTRTTVIGEQLADGRLNLNEARALEDRGPVPGGEFYNVQRPTQAAPTPREGVTP